LVEILDKDNLCYLTLIVQLVHLSLKKKTWDLNKLRRVLNNDPTIHKILAFQYLSLHMKTPIARVLPDREHLAHVPQYGLPIRVLAIMILPGHSNGFGSVILCQRLKKKIYGKCFTMRYHYEEFW